MAAISNPSLTSKYSKLNHTSTTIEYLFLDGESVRSKSKTLSFTPTTLKDIPSIYIEQHLLLRPVAMYRDPFRSGGILALCENCVPEDGSPETSSNYRYQAKLIMDKYAHLEPWFGVEQEYILFDPKTNKPYGWPKNGEPDTQSKYYCGVGACKVFGRDILEAHYRACLYAGITICGANVEVTPGQLEYQIGPCSGISIGDELWVARYIMDRVGEDFGIQVSLHPKPVSDHWNGTGAHINFSTNEMRSEQGGLLAIEKAIENMSLMHLEHIEVYGQDNHLRLTGKNETGHISVFSYGIGNRGASIRIPRSVSKMGRGYMEDRRPASNMDPYRVSSIIMESSFPSPSSSSSLYPHATNDDYFYFGIEEEPNYLLEVL
ncbi:glutamine synthetase/guanido kinase [Backusella circina FSU 941]|nr:glutamine synthetase/guanido kinase [Backusella circina FSU 941]